MRFIRLFSFPAPIGNDVYAHRIIQLRHALKLAMLSLFILSQIGFAGNIESAKENKSSQKKIGVLLVNHGSRSSTWRNALLTLEATVRPSLMNDKNIRGVKTAFMEYNEPSIATRMKEFDADGFTDVVIIPVFLTVSSHTFDDIPTILGRKMDPSSVQYLKLEKIERYTPRAATHIAPTIDFTDMLKKNILRRVQSLSTLASDEGLVMIAYGDAQYEKEWSSLLNSVGEYIRDNAGITEHSHGWCGHVAHYDPARTTDAIEKVLAVKKRALVVPVLVAHDEMFQVSIIGDGIAAVPEHASRVRYKPDSILPDKQLEGWIVSVAGERVRLIVDQERATTLR